MIKTLLPLLLLAPMVACGDSTPTESTLAGNGEAASVTANDDSTPATSDQAAAASGTMADMPVVPFEGAELTESAPRQEPKAPRLQPQAASSSRTPQFHFEDQSKLPDAELGDYYVEMDITIDGEDVGTMTFSFWPEKAPISVRNFLRYVDEGFYDNKIYHRIMRDFMIQGGSSTNTAAGQGPNGNIKGEFSDDPKYVHEYGVLSMARGPSPDSGSSQFFVITERSMSARGLDGKYSSFGKLVHGVATLEAIANIEVKQNPASGEPSMPTQRASIKEARVIKGKPTVSEKIERPTPDLHGEPERIRIQHVLISFSGATATATRTQEEAETLAKDVLARAQAGEDFDALVQELSDDPGSKETVPAGSYSLLNKGIRDRAAEDKAYELQTKAQALQQELLAQVDAKTITMEEARAQFQVKADAWRKELPTVQWFPRNQMVPAFGDIGFKLQVGEIGIANYDKTTSPFGWHIIKRYE